jgi:hypothetical protein
MHFHGPANTTANAPVIQNLAPFAIGPLGTSGTVSGTVPLTVPLRKALLNGQLYVNVHSSANPGGEIRGQIAPVAMTAGLNGVNERPAAVTTPGTGLGVFALVRDTINLVVTYGNLTGTASMAHIHGPAGFTGTAGVLVDLSPYNGGSWSATGSMAGAAPLTISQLLSVIDGSTYVNIHTAANGGGEIRGQIMR